MLQYEILIMNVGIYIIQTPQCNERECRYNINPSLLFVQAF